MQSQRISKVASVCLLRARKTNEGILDYSKLFRTRIVPTQTKIRDECLSAIVKRDAAGTTKNKGLNCSSWASPWRNSHWITRFGTRHSGLKELLPDNSGEASSGPKSYHDTNFWDTNYERVLVKLQFQGKAHLKCINGIMYLKPDSWSVHPSQCQQCHIQWHQA